MSFDLLITADVFLRVLTGGGENWEYVGSRIHQMNYSTLEICEATRDEYAARIAEFLEVGTRSWWLQSLGVESSELRIEMSTQCHDNAAQAQ